MFIKGFVMFIVINKKRIIIFVLIFICILGTVFYKFSREDNTLVAGGVLFRGEKVKYYEEEVMYEWLWEIF